jgi:hypothetical protein
VESGACKIAISQPGTQNRYFKTDDLVADTNELRCQSLETSFAYSQGAV